MTAINNIHWISNQILSWWSQTPFSDREWFQGFYYEIQMIYGTQPEKTKPYQSVLNKELIYHCWYHQPQLGGWQGRGDQGNVGRFRETCCISGWRAWRQSHQDGAGQPGEEQSGQRHPLPLHPVLLGQHQEEEEEGLEAGIHWRCSFQVGSANYPSLFQ